MSQLELPGMPPAATPGPDGAPVISEHVEIKVYPPTEGRPRWFVLVTHRYPGGQLVEADEHAGEYTPSYVGRQVGMKLEERFMALEPF